MAQLLFGTLRERKDVHTSVALLTTRMNKMDEDDWRKLQRILQYICRTIYIQLILRPDSLNVVKWWVDSLYSVYGYIRGHTGANMYLGCGSEIIMAKKPNINTRSHILLGRTTLYQGYTGHDNLSRRRVSLLIITSCIMKN